MNQTWKNCMGARLKGLKALADRAFTLHQASVLSR